MYLRVCINFCVVHALHVVVVVILLLSMRSVHRPNKTICTTASYAIVDECALCVCVSTSSRQCVLCLCFNEPLLNERTHTHLYTNLHNLLFIEKYIHRHTGIWKNDELELPRIFFFFFLLSFAQQIQFAQQMEIELNYLNFYFSNGVYDNSIYSRDERRIQIVFAAICCWCRCWRFGVASSSLLKMCGSQSVLCTFKSLFFCVHRIYVRTERNVYDHDIDLMA